MRIAVGDLGNIGERAAGLEVFKNRLFRLAHEQARDDRRAFDELAIAGDRVVDRQLVLLANHIVFDTVRRRGVHEARTRIERHVIAADHRHRAIRKRMLCACAFQ